MKRVAGLGLLLLAGFVGASVSGAEDGHVTSDRAIRLDRLRAVRESPSRRVALQRRLGARAPEGGAPPAVMAEATKDAYGVLQLEFEDEAACRRFAVHGATVLSRFQRFADVFVPGKETPDGFVEDERVFRAVTDSPGLRWAEMAASVPVPPPPKVERGVSARGAPEPIVRGGVAGLTGKGSIVAVVDSGVDFRHQDFWAPDAQGQPTSRFLYFWDTTSDAFERQGLGSRAPLSYPNGVSLGTLYSRDDLTADLRAPKPRIGPTDLEGHGTGCAGIAAGNGTALPDRRYAGVAPDADLIAVRISDSQQGFLENAYLLNAACGWLDQVAGRRPLVVSCSFSGQGGGRDGQSVEERQLSARFPPDLPGRILCVAAGNDGANAIHSEVSFSKAKPEAIIQWETAKPARIDLFFDTEDVSGVTMEPLRRRLLLARPEQVIHPLRKQFVGTLFVAPGPGALRMRSESGRDITCDAYLSSGRFTRESASFKKLIGSPGTTVAAITVGSYDWNDLFDMGGQEQPLRDPVTSRPLQLGSLSSYSGLGPSRNGENLKPEITAPGQWHAAPATRHAKGARDTSGKYAPFNGTSAATPYTAGVVALLLQKSPRLTGGELRRLLRECAGRDDHTGPVPNARWGFGKLNLEAVERLVARVSPGTAPRQP